MATHKGQPKPRTLKSAEKELHDRRSAKAARRASGYVVERAKGVKSR